MEKLSISRRLILGAAIGLAPLSASCKVDNARSGTPEHRQYMSPECESLQSVIPFLYQLTTNETGCSAFMMRQGLAVTPEHCISKTTDEVLLMHPVTLDAMKGTVFYKSEADDIALIAVDSDAPGYQDDQCQNFEPEEFGQDLVIVYSYQLPSGPQVFTHEVSYRGQNLEQIEVEHDLDSGYIQKGSSGGILCMKSGEQFLPIGMISFIKSRDEHAARILGLLDDDKTTRPLGVAVKLSECAQRAPQSAILCTK